MNSIRLTSVLGDLVGKVSHKCIVGGQDLFISLQGFEPIVGVLGHDWGKRLSFSLGNSHPPFKNLWIGTPDQKLFS